MSVIDSFAASAALAGSAVAVGGTLLVGFGAVLLMSVVAGALPTLLPVAAVGVFAVCVAVYGELVDD